MATVVLPELLSQLVGYRCYETNGSESAMAALSELFARHEVLKSCLLDKAGSLRQGIALYIDGREVRDRSRLSDAIGGSSEIRIATRHLPPSPMRCPPVT